MRSLLVLSAAVLLISACAPSKDMPTAPSSSTAAQALAAPPAFGLVTRSQVQGVSGGSLGACLSSAGLAGCSFEPGVSFEGGGAPPNAPNNLTASATGNVVTLAWSPPVPDDGILTYVVEAGSSPGLANLASVNTGSGNPSLVTGGVPPGTYYVRVRAATIGGAGPTSNEVTLVVGGGTPGCAGPPSAPANFAIATNAGGRVVLTWSASSGPGVSYVVQVGSSPGASNLLQSGTAATSVTATSVAAGTYYARVVAQSSCGTSGPSNEVTIVVGSAAIPERQRRGRVGCHGIARSVPALQPIHGDDHPVGCNARRYDSAGRNRANDTGARQRSGERDPIRQRNGLVERRDQRQARYRH